tara:strand:- start:29311 stop:30360 length:1050 start_codon:yes stop_codon:yes gene_type:complete
MTDATSQDIRLSAIIPNYNHGAFIGRAVDALLAQSVRPDEIIIVDDASTDNSRRVIAGLQDQHPALIRLITHDVNLGAIAALNRGLTEARGNYVYFGSADDVTHPTLFQAMISLLVTHPEAALACGETRLVDQKGYALGYRPIARPTQNTSYIAPRRAQSLILTTDHWILTGASVYRTDHIKSIGGFDASFGSFADGFASKQLALRYGFCFTPRVVADWRIDPDGYSRKSASDPKDALAIIDKIRVTIAHDPTFPPQYAELYARRWRFAVCRLALVSLPFNTSILRSMGGKSSWDRAALEGLARLRPATLSKMLILVWLTLRLRPTSLIQVFRTFVSRRNNSPRHTSIN